MKRGQLLKYRYLYVFIMAMTMGILLTPAMSTGATGPVTLKFSHQFPENDGYSKAATFWSNLVEKRTEGRVKFQHFYASSLVKSPQAFDSIKAGVADSGYCAVSFTTGKVPDLAVLELQAAVPDSKWVQVYREIEPVMGKIFAQNNIKYLWSPYIGRQGFVCKKRFLGTPDDYKGLKIRTAGRWITKTVEAWGGSPVFLDVGELYEALQRGTVDGANSVAFMDGSLKLYEVASYISYYSYLCSNLIFVGINMNKWNSISPQDQKTILESVNDVYQYSDQETRKIESGIISQIKSTKGVNVKEMTAQETRDLIKLTAPLWDEVRNGSGPLGKQLVDTLLKHREW